MEQGQQIGQYRLLDRLGEGGMGEVWKAEHMMMNRLVAIKLLHDGAGKLATAKERFSNEWRLQSRLQHPNIVSVLDVFDDNGRTAMVMEYIDGESLEKRLKVAAPGGLRLEEMLRISTDVLAALEYAHTRAGGAVVHRDIKPSNILIDAAGKALITDFGIAFGGDSHRMTRVGTTLGTVFYMSPEQIEGSQQIDGRTDIYSFGCVLYEMLAGRPPFGAEGDTDFTIKTMHVKDTPTPLRRWNGKVPFNLELIVYKALNKDPAKRFGTAAEMSRALMVAVSQELGTAPVATGAALGVAGGGWTTAAGSSAPPTVPGGAVEVPVKRRNRALPWILAAALLLLLGAGYAAYGALFADQVVLVLKGSTSVGDELAPKMAEAFLRQELKAETTGSDVVSRDKDGHAVVHVWGKVPGHLSRQVVEIYATGSGDAFKCLAAEEGAAHCDLGMSSRPYNEADRKKFPKMENLNSQANEHVIALDGIAVVVNPANPVSRISLAQLKAIYTGSVTNWQQVGGNDAPIEVYGRDLVSGTGEMFATMVVGKDASGKLLPMTVAKDRQMDDSAKVVDAVLKSQNAIGYVSSPLIREAKALAVSDGSGAPLRPTELAIVTEDYPIGRRLFLYQTSQASALAKRFVHYAVNSQGQAVVAEAHYVGLTPRVFPAGEIAPDAPGLYRQIAERDDKLGLSFRFKSGKAAVGKGTDEPLDNLAQDNVARLESYLAQHPAAASQVELVGYADNIGGRGPNILLAKMRAESVADSLKDADIHVTPNHILSMGMDMPVASNDTDPGKSRNRRVEVWIPKGTQ